MPDLQAAMAKEVAAAAPRLEGERRAFVRALLMSKHVVTRAGRHRRSVGNDE